MNSKLRDGKDYMQSKWICPRILQRKGMDMNHSKMEGMKRTTSSRSKWICPRNQKEGMEMDHSKMEGMKRTTCKKKL
jgi:uncharacterized protein involved in copper resistance